MSSLVPSLLLALLFVGTPGCYRGDPITVEHAAPAGELDEIPQWVELRFSHALIDPAVSDPAAQGLEVTVRPAVPGRITFPTAQSLNFAFTQGLQPATRYTVTIGAGLRSADGKAVLKRAHELVFTTRRNEIEAVRVVTPEGDDVLASEFPTRGEPMFENLGLSDRLLVTLRYPARVDQLRRLVRVEGTPLGADAGAVVVRALAPIFPPSEEAPSKQVADRFLIAPDGAWPKATRLRVIVGRGLEVASGQGGRELSREDSTKTVSTYGPLAVAQGPECEKCKPPAVLRLRFTTPVRCEDALAFIELAPKNESLACAGQPDERTFRIEPTPPLAARTVYKLTVKAGVKDAFGQELAQPASFALETGDRHARFAYQTMFNVLERSLARPHQEKVYGAAKLRVEGARLPLSEAWSVIASTGLDDQVAWSELPWWISDDWAYFDGGCYWDEEAGEEVCNQNERKLPGEPTGEVVLPPTAKTQELVADTRTWADIDVPLEPYLGGQGGIVVLKETPLSVDGQPLSAPIVRLVNVTDIGLSAKYSPTQLIVMAASLATGKPIAGAKVRVHARERWNANDAMAKARVAEAETDAQGIAVVRAAALAEVGGSADLHSTGMLINVTTADDEAFMWSKFRSGGERASSPGAQLVGEAYTERGIYRPGETVYFRVVARDQIAQGLGTPTGPVQLSASLVDSYGDGGEGGDAEIFADTLALSPYGTVTGSFKVPDSARVGEYELRAQVGDRSLFGGFRVAEFRRAEMKVSVQTTAPRYTVGDTLRAKINADYLFGAPAAGLDVRWSLRRSRAVFESKRHPSANFSDDDYHSWWSDRAAYSEFMDEGTAKLDGNGAFELTSRLVDAAFAEHLEHVIVSATVDDASGQSVSSRTVAAVHPGDVHVGIVAQGYLREVGKVFSFDVVAVTPDDEPATGVEVRVATHQEYWFSVQRRGSGGRMVWDYERQLLDEQNICKGKTDERGVLRCQLTPKQGGSLRLRAEARDAKGRVTRASSWSWVTGDPNYYGGRSDGGPQVGLILEKPELDVGETAKVVVTSPFQKGLAMVTVEREDILWREVLEIGTSGEISIPIRPEWVPNVYVSATVVRGRITPEGGLAADPERDKPAYALGYQKLAVRPSKHALKVTVGVDKPHYEPHQEVKAEVAVVGADGQPTTAEVNLYAVDEGVLMLTAYKTPALLPWMFRARRYSVLALDTRMHVLGERRFIVPVIKGEEDGGGGGAGGDEEIRKDFNPVAVWIGSLVTDSSGRATAKFKVPDTLTTYRVMAVAVTQGDRFGSGEAEFKVKKTLMMRQAMSRFARPGDRMQAGVVVNQLSGKDTEVTVSLDKIDDKLFTVRGERTQKRVVPASGTVAFRFDVEANDVEGASEIVFAATMPGGFKDKVQLVLPVQKLQPRESVGIAGVLDPGTVAHTVTLPAGARPVEFEMNLSALPVASLEQRLRGLIQYPYGCLEQRTSRIMPLLAARELAKKMGFTSIPTEKVEQWVNEWVKLVPKYACADKGFDYWEGCGHGSDPYLTAFALDGLLLAKRYGFTVPDSLLEGPARYLEGKLASMNSGGSSWDQSSSGLAGALRVLAQMGRWKESVEAVLFEGRAKMPLFAKTELARAIQARAVQTKDAPASQRAMTLMSEIGAEAKSENGRIVFASSDPEQYWWAWDSSIRSTAMALRAMLDIVPHDSRVPLIVRGLVDLDAAETYWVTQGVTQTLLALAEAAERLAVEGKKPVASISVGGQALVDQRSVGDRVESARLPGEKLQGKRFDIKVDNTGNGPLYFGGFFKYAYPATARLDAEDAGFAIKRRYLTKDGKPLAKEVKVGDFVMVELEIMVKERGRMVVIDDPLPAGLEPVDTALATSDTETAATMENRRGDYSWWRSQQRELRDDRVEFHFGQVWESSARWPLKLRYVARATTPGTYYAPGTMAERMYQPHIRGRGEGRELVVVPKD